VRSDEPAREKKPRPPPPARPPPRARDEQGGGGGKGLKIAIAAGVALLVVGGGVAALALGGGGDPVKPPPPPPVEPVVVADTAPPTPPDPTPPPPPDPPVATTDPAPPDPDPSTETPDPTPPPPDPQEEEVTLVVRSDPPARIRFIVAKKTRASGRSPATAKLPPGVVDVEVSDESQGLLKRERITLRPSAEPVKRTISVGKGTLLINSVPWAKVKVDGKDLGETPVKSEVYEGVHTVDFDCSNGKTDTQRVPVEEGKSKQVKSKCST
jgi:hypothetical protein